MYQNYLITGATGFLGRAVLQLLLAHSCRVLALVMDKDPLAYTIPENVTVFCGDLTDKDTLRSFFAAGGDSFCVLHCAGLVSIASKPDEAIYRVNVQGTRNIVDLSREFGAGRLIYVSSVHAIPEKPAPETITEPDRFATDEILGDYGKSKAMATALVLEAAQNGLNASVVLPSGIIGPGDLARGNMTRMLLAFCRGQLPLGVNGGYDFVDVRDVAVGVLACAGSGKERLEAAEAPGGASLFHPLCHRRAPLQRAFFKCKSNCHAWLPRTPTQRNAPEHDSLVSGAESDFSCSLNGMCPTFALTLPCLKNGNGQRDQTHTARSQ